VPANLRIPLFTSAAILLACGGLTTTSAFAETIQTDEYIYIGVEAEAFDTQDDRWVVTDASTPAIEQDPDGNHSDTSSGGVYLELLPDIRVTHADPMSPPTAFWGAAGTGPELSYTVTFPEAGRYYVHGRAFSTGTEDNGLHVGLNNQWPVSGRKMQFCTAAKRAWTWRSSQRDAGGNGSCGIEKTIWLDIPTAGVHTVNISAREDGFELDRFALIKDKSGNTRICSPKNVNEVTCRNGSIESADEFIDLRLLSSVDTDQANVGDTVNFTTTLENLDAFDTATDIEITISAGVDATFSSSNSHCDAVADTLVCTVNQQAPTSPSENETFEYSLVVSEAGEYVVETVATATQVDEAPENNTVIQSLVFDAVDISTEVSASLTASNTQLVIGDTTDLTVEIDNSGDLEALDVTATIVLPVGMSLSTSPSNCNGSRIVSCNFGSIQSNSSEAKTLGLTADAIGAGIAQVSIAASNDISATNNDGSVGFNVEAEMGGQTGGNPDVTPGSVTGETTGTPDTEVTKRGGAIELALLLLMLVVGSTRLYGLHQRKLVVLRK